MIDPADEVIDVREIVLRNFAFWRLPYFFPQSGTISWPLQQDRFIDDLVAKQRLLRLSSRLAQEGHCGTLLDAVDPEPEPVEPGQDVFDSDTFRHCRLNG